ncbi:MAG TPA: YjbH domain-containing protein [Rhodothermales bacterium]|nr:YjbH domain-containing protein [Rhodothermales bacterium]
MHGGRLFILLVFFAQGPAALIAQPAPAPGVDDIVAALAESGFENLGVVRAEDRLIVTYENRVYRYEIRAFSEVVSTIVRFARDAKSLTVIQQRHGLPLRSLTAPLGNFRPLQPGTVAVSEMDVVETSVDAADWASVSSSASRTASSFRRFDVTMQPHVAIRFGNYADALQTQIGLVPEIRTTIVPGLRGRAQVILPIQNELDEQGDYVRPGLVSINQTLRIHDDTFVSLSGGYFSHNRYGVDLESRTFLRGRRFSVGVRIGYTGYAGIRDGSWSQSSIGRLCAALTTDVYVRRHSLLIRSGLHRFVYGDVGWRLDVVRTFGEVQLGLFGLVSQAENNAGFSLAIPLFGRKYGSPASLRIRPARTFDWEYRYRGFQTNGLRYDTGHGIDDLWGGVFPGLFE